MTFIDTAGKLNKAPDYDSGCFSVAASGFVEKTHGLNSRDILVHIHYGGTDTDCINNGTSGSGRPMVDVSNSSSTYNSYLSSANNIEVRNYTGGTAYFRVVIWKVV